jgi:HK97 family phage major capsid protein
MKIDEMNLPQVEERLSRIDEEVRSATEVKMVDDLTQEKKDLLARKAELEDLEARRQTALDIKEGKKEGKTLETRSKEVDPEDKYATLEYRKAFMDYCRAGKEIPAEYRTDAFTAVADAAAVIPTTIMNEIIKEMKVYGQLFSRVRKTNVPGGVRVPILSLKPTATRITADGDTSDRKKIQANTYISFSYYGLECRVAVGLLTSAVTLPMFEQQITPLITEAMVKAQEIEIIKGTGEGQMLGVTVDTRVKAAQSVTLTSAEINQWDSWKKKVFAKIPLAYRAGGIFIMGAGTFDGYIDGMVDANGQPIGRVNYNITDGQAQRFGGKEVLLVEEDVVASYESANTGDVIAVFMNPSDYCINSNMQMAMYRWFDHDTNQWVDKAILINDGKLLDAAGVLLVKKGA